MYVLLYELLLGPNKSIRGGGRLKRELLAKENELRSKLDEEKQEMIQGGKQAASMHSTMVTIPRYIRINTLVSPDRDATIRELVVRQEGLQKQEEKLRALERSEGATTQSIYLDQHIPDVLVMAPTPATRAMLQDWVASHQVVLQDKSSCFSALCLVHGFDDDGEEHGDKKDEVYLDACAAPGNKTSHLAALLSERHDPHSKNKSKISVHALDKSFDRFQLLERRMNDLVPNGMVCCHNQDFLQTDGGGEVLQRELKKRKKTDNNGDRHTLPNVRGILLDPSCSGSGMTNSHHHYQGDESGGNEKDFNDPFYTNDRIVSLSNFQFQALLHSTTAFPTVDRIVYSTCSIYVQENEGVIQRVLHELTSRNPDQKLEWELVAPKCLRHWHRRGLMPLASDLDGETISSSGGGGSSSSNVALTCAQTKTMIRVDPLQDATNGFFVACLQRKRTKNGAPSTEHHSRNGTLIKIPTGMELYENQFDRSKETASPAKDMTHRKRKAEDESGKRKVSNESIDEKISKKRAKKMEWKKQQRLKKLSRQKKKEQDKKIQNE